MRKRTSLLIFLLAFVIAFIFWRLSVLFFYSDGRPGVLRSLTGLTFHHYHYGLIFILIAALYLIFKSVDEFSIGLMGFGLGSVYDSFISRLFSFNSSRMTEIAAYDYSFVFTLVLFLDVVLLSGVFYLVGRKFNKE